MKSMVLGLMAAGFLATVATAGEAPAGAPPKGEREGKMFAAVDTDGNGTVSLEEFKAFSTKRHEAMKPKDGQAAKPLPNFEEKFNLLDTDKSGGLSKEELAAGKGPRKAHNGQKPPKGDKGGAKAEG